MTRSDAATSYERDTIALMDPASLRYAHEQVKEFLRAGRLAEAETVCRQILQSLPNESQALAQLGIIATHARQFPAAVDLLRKAAFNAPWSAEHHYNLSEPLRLMGCLDEAIAALREAIRLKPTLAIAHSNLGTILAQQNQLDAAIEAFRKAFELAGNDAKIVLNLAYTLRRRERL